MQQFDYVSARDISKNDLYATNGISAGQLAEIGWEQCENIMAIKPKTVLAKLRHEIDSWHGNVLER